jgi:hypothetical protein
MRLAKAEGLQKSTRDLRLTVVAHVTKEKVLVVDNHPASIRAAVAAA